MRSVLLVFPHQLFDPHPGLSQDPSEVWLVEDALFFGDEHHPARFHRQKLWLHRASMRRYAAGLERSGRSVRQFDYRPSCRPLDEALSAAAQEGIERLVVTDPTDFLLGKRLRRGADRRGIEIGWLENPCFFNTPEQNRSYRRDKSRWFMADFYRFQRQRLGVLMEEGEPAGGQWSFDEANRKKIPKRELASIPAAPTTRHDELDRETAKEISKSFPDHPGSLEQLYYPTSHAAARRWLKDFLKLRLEKFGDYEDAIEGGQTWLWHSVLTPMLNIGLLTPREVLDATLSHATRKEVPLNSLEGFVRQLIGWREFMRATYEDLGVAMRTTNHWGHHRPMPDCFYRGDTGIDPVDDVIARLQRTGYCHHIERLMVLGGFMFLCELDPDDIYRWFMEMFVDSYDWVMVPNVYAMSQNADGGRITTKPYFSGSSYIKKMSHYRHGPWADTWDGLYWRWIWNHRRELGKNPRWAMMCRQVERMDAGKRSKHLKNAAAFLDRLDGGG